MRIKEHNIATPKFVAGILVALLLIYVAIVYLGRDTTVTPESVSNETSTPAGETITPVTIEDYVRTHISALSPEKEVMGGTFYVTDITAQNNKGTVWYEDGHIALVADFTYVTHKDGTIEVTTFTVRK